MIKSLLETNISAILDHVDTAWDEHREMLGLLEENLKWQKFLACSFLNMNKTISILEVALIRPLRTYLCDSLVQFRSRFEIMKQFFIIHKMYTQRIKVEFRSFQCLVTGHMPVLFDRERSNVQGRKVLRSKL